MATKEITYGQLMDMIREHKQPNQIKCNDGISYEWDGTDYRSIGLLTKGRRLIGSYCDAYLARMSVKYEIQPLDEIEKKYIGNIVRPFKDKVRNISKYLCNGEEWIVIYGDGLRMSFPFFDQGTMYKGMELDRQYTLEELGL